MRDSSSDAWGQQDDPFGEDFFILPPEEEIRARAEQIRQDNRDALQHFVELAIWEALDTPDLLKVLLSLLWLWEAVDARWLAEASFMSVGDVRDLVESQPIMGFPCLDCDTELALSPRWQQIRRHNSVEGYCQDGEANGPPAALLCAACQKQRNDYAEQQRRLDTQRQQAMLDEYRSRPYEERLQTKEWARTREQIFRRDGYRCRMCGRGNVQLNVHHCTYANYGEERLEDLITLCRTCHQHFHFRDVS